MTTKAKLSVVPKREVKTRPKDAHASKRPVQTQYYLNSELIRVNHAGYCYTAVMKAMHHISLDHYDANIAQVHDLRTGELYAVFKRDVNGKITTVFEAEVKEGR